ncbi:MAG: hypothetical protein KIT16_21280, partial [Rhodospirillaceae bacterium]|nr:hypothetical protein [Rhodospirillaceae bacterium]
TENARRAPDARGRRDSEAPPPSPPPRSAGRQFDDWPPALPGHRPPEPPDRVPPGWRIRPYETY